MQFWQKFSNIRSAKHFGACNSCEVSTMFLLHYISRTSSLPSSGSVLSLLSHAEAFCKANKRVMSIEKSMTLAQHAKRNYVLSRMRLVKCKGSTSAKLSVHEFDKAKEQIVNTMPVIVAFHDPRIYCSSAEDTGMANSNRYYQYKVIVWMMSKPQTLNPQASLFTTNCKIYHYCKHFQLYGTCTCV